MARAARPDGVEALDGAVRAGDEGEEIAADAGHLRLHDGLHRGRRHGGVDGVSARFEHLQRGCRGQVVRGCHGAAPGNHGGTSGLVKIAHDLSSIVRAVAGTRFVVRRGDVHKLASGPMPKSRRAARMDTEKPAITSNSAIAISRKNVEVAAWATSRNSTRQPTKTAVESM